METVTVSTKYQVVIPKLVRRALGIRPGTKVQVIEYDGRIEYMPVKKPAEMRGFVRGIDTEIKREKDRL
ncbi:MAG: AbrB/MazE/SpoVT family DNA-binding domain-containing protein [Planctomycetota bacterium]